ncbi:MAG: endonuclease/exonuclease/phosphatase family protein [Phycisphaerales bacterium]
MPADLPPIVLDGRFDDWANRPPALIDPADAGRGSLDFGLVVAESDASFLHLLVELGRTVNLQKLDGRVLLVLDADGSAGSGTTQSGLDGADLLVTFSPPNEKAPEKPGEGVRVSRWADGAWSDLGAYGLDVSFAPTVAANRAEIRLARGRMANGASTLDGEMVRGKFIFIDAAGVVRDETDVFTHRFASAVAKDAAPVSVPDPTSDPLARAEGTVVRVVSWNVERGAMFLKDPDRFARVLRALAPDVILLEELTDKQSAEEVAAWLDARVPASVLAASAPAAGATTAASPGTGSNVTSTASTTTSDAPPWRVVFGAGGGNLRTAVATRLPLRGVDGLDRIGWRDERGTSHDVRFSTATVEVGGKPLLACAVHLKCCGRMNSDEDLTRLEEAQAVRAAVRALVRSGRVAGVLVGGDYNLVGSAEPLELMTEDLDVDGTDLAVAQPLQLDRRTAATWEDPLQPFTPSRLDYLVYSDATLEARGGFVFDTRDLSPRWLERHGVRADDTTAASDHLPLVVDLAWR